MMRKTTIFPLLAVVLATASANAQEWLKGSNAGPVKLEEVAARFREQLQNRMAEETPDQNGKIGRGKSAIREGHNYHFDRWYWHAYSHTDENGYIVSPQKTHEEWKAYNEQRRHQKTTNNSADWTFHGPTTSPGADRGLGRITTVEFHPTDTATFWVATAGGGAWKTTDGGTTWTNMTGGLTVLGTSDVDINPLNPDVIYLCTGDKNASDTYSLGVLKSTDGGLTWNATGLQWLTTNTRLTNELVINRLDTSRVTVATSVGIYQSSDGGDTWSLILSGDYKQLVYHPTDTSVLYAASGFSSVSSSQVWRSKDGGATWAEVSSIPNSRRVRLAVTPAAPNMVKLVAANTSYGLQGIYSSHDTGSTFTLLMTDSNCRTNILHWDMNLAVGDCGGQGWYDLAIAVSPLDSNNVFVGGVNTWHSTDGGTSWDPVTHWISSAPGVKTVHADKHELKFHPLQPTTLFECNDGGIYRTDAPTALWTDLTNGMGITQFYRLAVSDTAEFVVGGAQDNGSKRMNHNGTTLEVGGGDGMNCEMDPTNPMIFYASSQYGNMTRTINGGNGFTNIANGLPQGEWITPYQLHPRNPSVIVSGRNRVYASMNRGSAWSVLPGTFNSNLLFKRVALAGNNPAAGKSESYIYTLYGNSNINWSSDFGTNWNTASNPAGTVSDLQVDPWDSTHIWITFSGYSPIRKVAEFRTTGTGWTHHNTGLPNIPVHCMIIDKQNGTQYIGTDVGVFFRDTSMTAWEAYTTGLPSIEVTDLAINYKTNEVWASTYGRGMWKSPRHITLAGPDPSKVTIVPLAAGVLTVAPNPSNGAFVVRTGDQSFWSKNSTVRLYDAVGRVAWVGSASFNSGGQMSVQTAGVARGTYILEVATQAGALARTRVVMVP
jgi:photosystem II stability/assembly factor-like uncharacterized protein